MNETDARHILRSLAKGLQDFLDKDSNILGEETEGSDLQVFDLYGNAKFEDGRITRFRLTIVLPEVTSKLEEYERMLDQFCSRNGMNKNVLKLADSPLG